MAMYPSDDALKVMERLRAAYVALEQAELQGEDPNSARVMALKRDQSREFWALWNLCEESVARVVRRFMAGAKALDYEDLYGNARLRVFRSIRSLLTEVKDGERVFRQWASQAEIERYIATICFSECIDRTREKNLASLDGIDVIDNHSDPHIAIQIDSDDSESGEFFSVREKDWIREDLVNAYIAYLKVLSGVKEERVELIRGVLSRVLDGVAGGVVALENDVACSTVSKILAPFKEFLQKSETQSFIDQECPSLTSKLGLLANRGPEFRGRPSKKGRPETEGNSESSVTANR